MNSFVLCPTSYEILSNGDSGYSLVFKEEISLELTMKLIAICDSLKNTPRLHLTEIIPSYQSITLIFDRLLVKRKLFREKLNEKLSENFSIQESTQRLIEIPVCYEKEYAPDLFELARLNKLPIEEVIRVHSSSTYWVNMLGFLPGFLYLSGLDEKLNCPRKQTPSLQIAPGSIAIGGSQTGIYPVASPGGWHVIGRTPIRIFDPGVNEPAIARPLDKVKFIPISKADFLSLSSNSGIIKT